MTVTLTALQKQRRDTASNWTSNNTVLLAGEWGIESDTKKFKIGDGTTAWQQLAYVPIPDANGNLSGNVNATGNVSAGGTLAATGNATIGGTLGVTGDATLAGNATVQGDFTVNGTTTTVNTTNLDVEDKNITLGKVSNPSDTTADGGGITLKGATDKTLNWVDATDSWTSSEHFSVLNQKEVRYFDSDASNYLGFKAPATVATNIVWTLPNQDAAVNGYVLASDGNGNLSWVDAGSSTNPSITGDITLQNDGLIRGFSSLQATYTGSTKVLLVTVSTKTANHRYNGSGSNNGYKINGYEAPFITLTAGRTYRFDQSDATNANHPLRFYLEADKTTAYTTGVTVNGTAGQAGAYTEISVTDTTPLILHYQCSAHAYMGNAVSTNSNVVNYNDLLNKPTIPTNNNQLTNGAGFIDGSALNASNLSSGTIPDARFPATLPVANASNLTNLDATDLSSGTIPDARFPATLPAISGANLTDLDAADLASGTIPDARFPSVLPAISGANLTNLPSASSIGGANGVDFNDGVKARFGDNNDLQIYHNPNSYIVNNSGDLEVQNGNRTIGFKSDTLSVKNGNDNETMATFTADGSVDLYHDNTVRISTSSAGATVTGNLTATGNVTAYSDERMKTDITTINDALSIVGKLRGVYFRWIKEEYKDVGLIAQEVEKVIPEVIWRTEDDVKTLDYGRLVSVLINAVNELKAEVDKLKGN